MAINSSLARPRRPAPQTTKSQRMVVPARGMDGRVNLGQATPDVAIYQYNILSSEYGMRVRSGFQEHCINLVSVTATGVKTIIPYESSDTAQNRLFAVTNEGIWDCTEYDTPVLVFPFSITTDSSGIGNYIQYITDANESILFYADEENGLHTYAEATGLWTVTGGITGADATKVRFIMNHKQRIWLIEKDSGDAWYLPLSSIAGLAVKFQFGQQFKHGGSLAGLYNWTVDGGIGVDDYLVAISSSGDVLPYQGADPEATNDWQNRGVYYVGEVAKKRQCAASLGGDLAILSTFGVTSLASLLSGEVVQDMTARGSVGDRMAFVLQDDLRQYPIDSGWSIDFLPAKGDLIIKSPIQANDIYLQYVYDISNDSFGWWRGVPMISFEEWQNIIYIGTADNRVLAMNVDLDEVKITPVTQENGQRINFSALFAFSPLDASAAFKRGVAIRPDFMSTRKVEYQTRFAYDYEIVTFTNTLSGNITPAGRWDNGIWDQALWGSSELINRAKVVGGSGMGRTLAVAINGSGTSDTWLISYDVMWNSGGML
jgi:hypothetical protein